MPNKCVRCSVIYDDTAQEILKGCPCGARLFFYVKKKKLEEAKKLVEKLNEKQKEQIETDVKQMLGIKESKKPIILDFESIRVLKPGKYEIDLKKMFNKEPLVFELGEGKYIIDINKTLNSL